MRRSHWHVVPPSTMTVVPVIQEESSDARKTTAA